MKKIIRLTESDLHEIVRDIAKEYVRTIRLQLINDYFYPTDAISKDTLERELGIPRIPKKRIEQISSKLVANGYKLAINDYNPESPNKVNNSAGQKIGGIPKPQQNPCTKCGLKKACDSDDCGKKHFRLTSNK